MTSTGLTLRGKAISAGALLACLCLLHAAPGAAQETANNGDPEKIRNLLVLLYNQIETAQKELNDLAGVPPTKSVNQRKEELQSQLDQINKNFESIATQLNTEDLLFGDETKTDWSKEIQDLTAPLLQAMRELTKKPRKIEQLKKKTDLLENQLAKYESAYNNLKSLLAMENAASLADPGKAKYISYLKTLTNKYDPELARLKLEEARRNLQEELADKKSLVDLAAENINSFFKHRGRNLLITSATFGGLWWLLFGLRGWIVGKRSVVKLSPRLKKALRVAYNAVVLAVCIAASLASLYLLNDWLLLSVVFIALIAIGWTSRQLIPRFLHQLQLALNLGTVRENERLIWNGIPWLVKSIGLQAVLENERLEEETILLPLKELIGKYSRPVVKDEPWFPTRLGDWVVLSDGVLGKVERQTQEQVVLRLKGESLKYYLTPDFLKLSPMNISSGFRYEIEFGLDYGLQPKICDEVPELFEKELRRLLQHHLQEKSPDFTDLKVDFGSAASSSLNLEITIGAAGRCAGMREDYEREINSALVRICNENGLTIPFNQITVNLSGDSKNPGNAADRK